MKRGKMDDWPCMKAERDLAEATKKLEEAHRAVAELLTQKPVGDMGQLQEWQHDLAEAHRRETETTSAHQKAAKDFEECKEQNPRPGA
jgi:cellobiose-specific phosphotransferase system component IIA